MMDNVVYVINFINKLTKGVFKRRSNYYCSFGL